MQQTELNVSLRERVGKGGARTARREGLIPGVVYGPDIESTPIVVHPKDLDAAMDTDAGINTLITLRSSGQPFDGMQVIVNDLQVDPIKRFREHVDFKAIDLMKKGYFMVPVHTEGESAGEEEGGNLQVIRNELEVYCLPTKVPSYIGINVADLVIGDSVHIEDVKAPADVELVYEVNFTVVTVVGFKPSDLEEDEEGEEGEESDDAETTAEVEAPE
ncbi:MAG: 50S ribosomal protein L25 [Desulfuromonadaceae bacterium]